MTIPDTATEAAAAAQRAADKIMKETRAMLQGEWGWLGTNRIEAIIAAEIAPLQQRAEAADRLAEALMPLSLKVINLVSDWNADSDNKQFKHPFTKLAKQAESGIAAHRALAEAQP